LLLEDKQFMFAVVMTSHLTIFLECFFVILSDI